jgi:hypothetical protein
LAGEHELALLKGRLGSAMRRRDLRESIGHYLDGLLSGLGRKTGWLSAKRTGGVRLHRR